MVTTIILTTLVVWNIFLQVQVYQNTRHVKKNRINCTLNWNTIKKLKD